MIYHVRIPNFTEYRFEWHPQTRRVYVIRMCAVPEVGEVLAHEIMDRGAATNAVLIWCRGYREAKAPSIGGLELHEREGVARNGGG